MIVAGVTLVSFARVIRALFDPEVRASDRMSLLRGRVRGMISEFCTGAGRQYCSCWSYWELVSGLIRSTT